MAPLTALVFDLDDTLYPEASYVRSGFQEVAHWFEVQAGVPSEQTLAQLWSAHLRGDRGRLFDGLLATHPCLPAEVTVAALLQVYRSHEPKIVLYDGMAALLEEAKARQFGLAVISDGFLEAQRRKVQALDLSTWFAPILLTDTWGRAFWKPDARAFREAARTLGAEPEGMVYVGNNPTKDFQAPRAMGWHTVQLKMPGQLPFGEPIMPAERLVDGINDLRALLLDPR